MLNYLIYVSMAKELMSQDALLNILKQSRDWNTTHNITGMLIYIEGLFINTEGRAISTRRSGRFMQVLEGPKEELDMLFNHIQNDKRHHHVTLLHRADIADRNFETWQMGFQSLTLEQYRSVPSFFELDQSFKNAATADLQCLPLKILQSFYHRGSREATLFSTSTKND